MHPIQAPADARMVDTNVGPLSAGRAPNATRRLICARSTLESSSLAMTLAQPPADLSEMRRVVRATWGITELRPLQEETLRAVLAGRDLLLVLPTGAGKSLCYQAPALVRAGLTVVVSPLISLMKDQVDGLLQTGVAAAMLTSAQDAAERRGVHEALERGAVRILYVAPERLVQAGFLARLVQLGLAALAVDEAHCISHWGHDFRPEYRQLGELRRLAPHVPIHAFTATATERVRRDVVAELGLVDPAVIVGPIDRPNLTYRVRPRGALLRQALEVVERHRGRAGIVYCLARRDVDELAADLAGAGVRAVAYHAGLEPEARSRAQERFLDEEVDVVVATIAFGMGIDRTDVRFVVHASLPKGLEQYQQETGRAGRDGEPAECVLLWSGQDLFGWRALIERSHAEAGSTDAVALDGALERLRAMAGYAARLSCRHRQLAEHFGQSWDAQPGGCGACDVCLGELAAEPEPLVLVQKILSCVVRCEQRYGAAHVADVLRGADTANVRRAGHDRLTTYGLLRERGVAEVRSWIDQLVAQDLLRLTGERFPVLILSKAGVEAVRGEREVVLWAPPRRPRAAERAADASGPERELAAADRALFEDLRALRRELARERGVPPYLIFNDRTLAELAARRPCTRSEFLSVKGVGERKADDLGPVFLERISRWVESPGAAADARAGPRID
jgi:ATP-dependent DNA helicase RecQ